MSWCRSRRDLDSTTESCKQQSVGRSPKEKRVLDGNGLGNLKLLTAEEVAELLRVNRSSVYRWVEQGLLSAIKVGRTVRFNPDTVKAVLEHGLAPKES